MEKLRLEPTAALVMQWASKLYNDGAILRFVNQLDLSSGKGLFDNCNAVCSWYDEVIMNRKIFIRYLIEQELNKAQLPCQLVFLAAGKSPLSLEILSGHSSKVYRIFEVDLSGMAEKNKLYGELFPEFSDKVKCLNADIISSNILNVIDRPDYGFCHDLPVIILLEGISYYLRKQELKNIIAGFQNEREATFIIEFLLPDRNINTSRRFIPKEIFRIIQNDCNQAEIVSYTKDELGSLFHETGGELIAGYSMADMELLRTGDNKFFKEPGDWWIECVIGRHNNNYHHRLPNFI